MMSHLPAAPVPTASGERLSKPATMGKRGFTLQQRLKFLHAHGYGLEQFRNVPAPLGFAARLIKPVQYSQIQRELVAEPRS